MCVSKILGWWGAFCGEMRSVIRYKDRGGFGGEMRSVMRYKDGGGLLWGNVVCYKGA